MNSLLDAIANGVQIIDLAHPLWNGMPCSPNHPGFRMSLLRRHGDGVRPDGSSAANELIVTGGHVGTHIDALSHVSHQGQLHGGIDAAEAQRGGRFSHHGVDTIKPLFTRGVLLDVAAAKGVEVLEGGYPITPDDLEEAAAHGGVEVREGDVALVRSGWAHRFDTAESFLGHETGVPGPNEDAAHWLADRGIVATGADSTAYEHIPPGEGHRVLPAHRILLVEEGINIIEVMNLEDLSAAGVHEFLFVLAPLKILGGTGSPVRPLAVVA